MDVERLYEKTPFIFEAGKELKMQTPLSIEENKNQIEQAYADTPSIIEASEGDGGIIKNRDTSVFPYNFQIDLTSYMHSSELS